MKKVIILSLILSAFISVAQPSEKDEVFSVVQNVFEAMRNSDSTLLKSCFTENPNFFTAFVNPDGISKLTTGNFPRFVSAVGQPKEQVWNEPIWNEQILIDDNLASVWVDYAFYVNDQFSHCGVDAFHLVKLNGQWKIFHLVDTRRQSPCKIPDELKP